MVRIISLPNPRLAQAFIDYMATQGVRLELEVHNDEVVLWLADDAQQTQVEQELARFCKSLCIRAIRRPAGMRDQRTAA